MIVDFDRVMKRMKEWSLSVEQSRCKVGKWYLVTQPDGRAFPAKIVETLSPHHELNQLLVNWGSEGQEPSKRWWSGPTRCGVKFENVLYELDAEQFVGSGRETIKWSCQVGARLLENLSERIRLCSELTRHKMPLAAATRAAMARLFENDARLDELIAETVTDLLKERGDGE